MPNYEIFQLVTDASDPTRARMYVYGDIARDSLWTLITGEEDRHATDSLSVVDALAALPATARSVEVHINSYGGDVSEGVAIYNALKGCGRDVTTVCDGFACSIASVVFMAGARRVMRPASLLMLHMPYYQQAGGNARALRKAADDLDVIAELSKAAYLSGGGIDEDTLSAVMDAETWVSPSQALEWGLATDVEDAGDGTDGAPAQFVGLAVVHALAGDGQRPRQVDERLHEAAEEAAKALAGPETEPEPEQNTDDAPDAGQGEHARGYARLASLMARAAARDDQ